MRFQGGGRTSKTKVLAGLASGEGSLHGQGFFSFFHSWALMDPVRLLPCSQSLMPLPLPLVLCL